MSRFSGLVIEKNVGLNSSAEIKLGDILSRLGYVVIPYSNKSDSDPANTIYSQVPFQKMRLDFALTDAKIAIEMQGDYWHANAVTSLSSTQAKNKLRDQRKEKSLRKNGWNLIKIWERDIDDGEKVGNHIKNSILSLIEI